MSVIRWQFYSLKTEPFNAIKFSGIDISVADFKDLVMKEKGMKGDTSKLVVIDASNNEGNRVWLERIKCSMMATFLPLPCRVYRRYGHDSEKQASVHS